MERKESIGKEATSKKTLEDVEENEVDVKEHDGADLPSPDGAFDDSDALKDADPL